MALSAEINGVKVFSDKEVRQVSGGRITFADGSWCDTRTKEVVNKGPGQISIGTPLSNQGSANMKKIGPLMFEGRRVEVRNICADLAIVEHNRGLGLVIEGPEAEVDAIKFSTEGGYLTVQGKGESAGRSNNSSISIWGNSSHNSIVSIGSTASQTKISITVPIGAEVKVDKVSGNTSIGHTLGPVDIRVSGHHDLLVGRVSDALLTIAGSGDITVAGIEGGNLTAQVRGSGDIEVLAGAVRNLEVTIAGSGDFTFNGHAEQADLSIKGSGDITVKKVTQKPRRSKSGSGDIDVGNW